jgi:hypothetical protein
MTVSDCHGGVLTRDDLQRSSPSAALDIRVYAVAKARARPDPRSEHLVVFASRLAAGQDWGLVYEVGAGGYVHWHGGCGASPQETLARLDAMDFLLAPP